MVGFFRGAGLSYISVIFLVFILDLINKGSAFSIKGSLILGVLPFIFPIVYLVCLITEALIKWAEFKFYEKQLAFSISIGMGVIIGMIFFPFFFQIIFGSIFYYLGRNIIKGKLFTILFIFLPLLFLLSDLIYVRSL